MEAERTGAFVAEPPDGLIRAGVSLGGMAEVGDLSARVRELSALDPEEFVERAREDAAFLTDELTEGTFDNHQSILGLEYEFYAVTEGRWHGAEQEGVGRDELARVPRRLLQLINFEKEIGLHNAELTASPQPFNPAGLRAIASEVRSQIQAAQRTVKSEGMWLVSDAMWTIPPCGETAASYLGASVEDRGVQLAVNMSDNARYHGMSNGPRSESTYRLEAPYVDCSFETVMPVALTTSIQPHYQVPTASDLPRFHNYAVRVAGPLLALAVNSPFLPPDLYTDAGHADPEAVLREGWQEHRVPAFETLNEGVEKVGVPRDLSTVTEAVERVANDDVIVPMPEEELIAGGRFDDRFATLRRKHGTYWRWVRPVFDGGDRAAANARIEFRPIPAQPTVADSVAFLAAFAGLMECLPHRRHPTRNLEWELAQENFRAAVRDGVAADMTWITHDGRRVTDTEAIYSDLLEHARVGLVDAGFDEREADGYLAPLWYRVENEVTPASWKVDRARTHLDEGADLTEAIHEAQHEYVDRQRETLLEETFADW